VDGRWKRTWLRKWLMYMTSRNDLHPTPSQLPFFELPLPFDRPHVSHCQAQGRAREMRVIAQHPALRHQASRKLAVQDMGPKRQRQTQTGESDTMPAACLDIEAMPPQQRHAPRARRCRHSDQTSLLSLMYPPFRHRRATAQQLVERQFADLKSSCSADRLLSSGIRGQAVRSPSPV
jgi:hypothetical protein